MTADLTIVGQPVTTLLKSLDSSAAKITVDMNNSVKKFVDTVGFPPGKQLSAEEVLRMLHKLGVVN